MTDPAETRKPAEAPDAPQADQFGRKRRLRHGRALFAPAARALHKIPHPPWRSKRGILLLVVLLGGFGAVATMGGATAIGFSETPVFCGMCHTMDPELKAYAMSPHKDVGCAECHVKPGVAGFVEAKANGTKQLFDIISDSFPTPIPAPDHAKLPPVTDTCLKCHSLSDITENGGPIKLILRPKYLPDEANTTQPVAVMIRPGGLGAANGLLGVHWHVQKKVTYATSDIHSAKIDLVEIKATDGTTKQYIAGSQVTVSTDVKADIARLKLSETNWLMDCIDCHNRIVHEVPSPDQAIDQAMADGKINATLPFIKRDGLALLNANYPTLEAADTAIAGLSKSYATHYPLVFKAQGAQVTQAINELEAQYRLIATPAMKVQAKTYPDNLGHQTSLGCFRCHDGAHYLVVKGQVTTQTIPSACSTCHTFPQVGQVAAKFPLTAKAAVSSVASVLANIPLGATPPDHADSLYVFSHKNATLSVEPTGTSCAACHTRSYCENCHNSGAIKVNHDKMLTNHANAVTDAGGTQACTYCHLPISCVKCHKGPVLVNKPVAAVTGKQTP